MSADTCWIVTGLDGHVVRIAATWCFNNSGELCFRKGRKGNSQVIALFAPGQWSSCMEEAVWRAST
jgi:hypothetical protein